MYCVLELVAELNWLICFVDRPQRDRPSRDTRENNRQQTEQSRGLPSGDNLSRINQYPDSQQVFVGNLPHTMSEKDLKEYFGEWGTVVDSRINKKSDRNTEVPVSFSLILKI